MASWLKWTIASVAGCAVIALLAVRAFDPATRPATAAGMVDEDGRPNREHPLVVRSQQIREELIGYDEALRHRASVDSARALLPDSADVVFALQAVPPRAMREAMEDAPVVLADSSARAVQDAVERQLERMGGRSAARIAVVTLPAHLVSTEGLDFMWALDRVRYAAGTDDGGPYCLVIIQAYAGDTDQELASAAIGHDSPLGPCRLWARYGPPGARVGQWLGRAGHLMDEERGSLSPAPPQRRELLGFRGYTLGRLDFGMEACLAGRTEICESAVRDPLEWRPRWYGRPRHADQALHTRPRYYSVAIADAGSMFAALEAELGPERFGRFWRSEDDGASALSAALGEDFGAWAMRWARSEVGAEPLGPNVPPGTGVLSLLTIVLLAGTALGVAQRRQIG